MKKQVLVIGGGETFDSYEEYFEFLKNYEINFEKLLAEGWKNKLRERLGGDYEIILAKMPNFMNAKYEEWKIYFEKLIPFLKEEIILLGHSLGGIFLAKYLSENDFPKKIKATILVAAVYDDKGKDDEGKDYSLADFVLPASLDKFQEQGGKIFLYHSKDDMVVPFEDLRKYQKALPKAETIIFEDRGHFNQEEFPEIVEAIRKLA
jgi:predicted alpha/beta hydrolase family esterase